MWAFVLIFSSLCFRRHERIHTKKGSHMKSPTDLEQVHDLATLEVLDEVRPSTLAGVELSLAVAFGFLDLVFGFHCNY